MKRSKKILLSLVALTSFASLPVAAISCQTPAKPEEPKTNEVDKEKDKKPEEPKTNESQVDPLVTKANEKAKALAVDSNFTFNLGSDYTKSTLLEALKAQGAVLAYSYTAYNIALYNGKPDWKEASQKQIFEVNKSFVGSDKEVKYNFQVANPDSPTYKSSKNNQTKINSQLKFTINEAEKTITLEFKGAFFVPRKEPVIGTEVFRVVLPIQLEEATTDENSGTDSQGGSGSSSDANTSTGTGTTDGSDSSSTVKPNEGTGSEGTSNGSDSTDQGNGSTGDSNSAGNTTGGTNTEATGGDQNGSSTGEASSSTTEEGTGTNNENGGTPASDSSNGTVTEPTTSTPGSETSPTAPEGGEASGTNGETSPRSETSAQ
ncbi:hypothetical protein AB5V95_02425 [Metamycoplasma spumans]|uniref:hypothetical protein n=1 Tax=Metamycoplasma spumans TaxID=92406 RepID=UPI0034DDBFA1